MEKQVHLKRKAQAWVCVDCWRSWAQRVKGPWELSWKLQLKKWGIKKYLEEKIWSRCLACNREDLLDKWKTCCNLCLQSFPEFCLVAGVNYFQSINLNVSPSISIKPKMWNSSLHTCTVSYNLRLTWAATPVLSGKHTNRGVDKVFGGNSTSGF